MRILSALTPLLASLMASRPDDATDVEPIRRKKPGQGSERRHQRELDKAKANRLADAERKKRMSRKATVSDVELIGETHNTTAVFALGQRIGTIKERGDKFVLFDNAAVEVSERARIRDLKKAAAALYGGSPEPKVSRQVRRRLERKGR